LINKWGDHYRNHASPYLQAWVQVTHEGKFTCATNAALAVYEYFSLPQDLDYGLLEISGTGITGWKTLSSEQVFQEGYGAQNNVYTSVTAKALWNIRLKSNHSVFCTLDLKSTRAYGIEL